MISRKLHSIIEMQLFKGKAIIVIGARQTCKAMFFRQLIKNMQNVLWLNADEPDTVALLSNSATSRLKATFSGKKLL